MESKIIRAAKAAKAAGYKYMTSVVKSHFATTYYNVVKIDDVLAEGKWIRCQSGQCGNWHGPIGVSTVPEKSINKSEAILRYCR